MTLNEAREVLAGAAWTRETPLVALFDEIIEKYDKPLIDQEGKQRPSAVTRRFADYQRGQVSSGRVAQLVVSLRQQNGMPLYALQG